MMNRLCKFFYNVYMNLLGYGIIVGLYMLWAIFLVASFFVRIFAPEKPLSNGNLNG